MNFLPAAITLVGGYAMYRMTNYSLGRESDIYHKRDRLHKATFYSDYNDPTEFIKLLKIPPENDQAKFWLYVRTIPGMSKRKEIDMGNGAYFEIDERQWQELLQYRQNFNIRFEEDYDKTGMKGTPMVSDKVDPGATIPQMKASPKFQGVDYTNIPLDSDTHKKKPMQQGWWKETTSFLYQ